MLASGLAPEVKVNPVGVGNEIWPPVLFTMLTESPVVAVTLLFGAIARDDPLQVSVRVEGVAVAKAGVAATTPDASMSAADAAARMMVGRTKTSRGKVGPGIVN